MESPLNGWVKYLAAPLISALITGGIMYVAVRVELAQVAARQEMMIRSMDSFKQEMNESSNELVNVRERMASLETEVRKSK